MPKTLPENVQEADKKQVTETWPQSYAAWWRAEADFKQRPLVAKRPAGREFRLQFRT